MNYPELVEKLRERLKRNFDGHNLIDEPSQRILNYVEYMDDEINRLQRQVRELQGAIIQRFVSDNVYKP